MKEGSEKGKRVVPLQESAFVCPKCKGVLKKDLDQILCLVCGGEYLYENGFPNFLVGGRFEDERDDVRAVIEEQMDEFTTVNYLLPLIERTKGFRKERDFRILSVGCGVGRDVDILNEVGYECFGVDCGSRITAWSSRKHSERLLIANGQCLPFPDNYFNFVFSGGVIEHVGVVGDTTKTKPSYREERLRFAREICRVTRRGGSLVLSCPNRMFPFDLFHRKQGYLPRFHLPTENFLFSCGDFKKLFLGECRCQDLMVLPTAGYWGYNRLVTFWLGKVLQRIISAHFKIVSSEKLPFLRRSFLNPWLVILVKR